MPPDPLQEIANAVGNWGVAAFTRLPDRIGVVSVDNVPVMYTEPETLYSTAAKKAESLASNPADPTVVGTRVITGENVWYVTGWKTGWINSMFETTLHTVTSSIIPLAPQQ